MSSENRRQPRIEPAPSSDAQGDIRLAFFIAAAMCIASAITGLRDGNMGGFVALGMGAISAIVSLRA